MNREDIVAEIFKRLQAQKSVRLGKLSRDPITPEELPKTGFPAAYIETTDEDILDISYGGGRQGTMLCDIVLFVSGANRDTQRNITTSAIEATLMADRTLNSNVEDIALTRIETINVGEAAPYASFRLTFTITYCYNLED